MVRPRATFIEMDYKILKLVRENLHITKLEDRAETLQADAFKFLTECKQQVRHAIYDIIYVAPPQYQEMAARALQFLDTSPLVPTERRSRHYSNSSQRSVPPLLLYSVHNSTLTDERRYGSTLLMFYQKNTYKRKRQTMVSKPGKGTASPLLTLVRPHKRLGIDRVTLDQWIKEGRIKTHRGVGRDAFFRCWRYRCPL